MPCLSGMRCGWRGWIRVSAGAFFLGLRFSILLFRACLVTPPPPSVVHLPIRFADREEQ